LTAEASLAPGLTEAELVRLWEGRRFPEAALVTRAGVALRVLHQGRRGRGAGPDFRSAVLVGPAGIPLRGDVELHLRTSSFRTHGHHRDHAYDRLILHVVLEDDEGVDTRLASGRSVPVVALGRWLGRRRAEIERWLSCPALVRAPCAGALTVLGADRVGGLLDRLGDARLAAKATRLAERAAAVGWDQALWEGMLEALGYGGPRALLRDVAERLPWPELARRVADTDPGQRVARLEALLLGSAGLLSGGIGAGNGRLAERWRREGRSGGPTRVISGCRPQNRPGVRLQAAARLAVRYLSGPALLLNLLPAARPADLVRALVVRDGAVRLGPDRAREIVVNVLLPGALAAGRPGVEAAYTALPAGRYGRLAALESALASLPLNARRSQGLLALEREHCRGNGCGGCPLATGA